MESRSKLRFRSVQLHKHNILGIGSYGFVCNALCDDLPCAAKILHPTLFNPMQMKPQKQTKYEQQREHRQPIQRFLKECELMSEIRHPNIVQYLGLHIDPETCLPVLLMELMSDNLTHFLECLHDSVPYHVQVNFCHGIALAISYLHSNGIIHRDLSSNNVLLCVGNMKVKVTDFGMVALSDLNPHTACGSFTKCPGTDAYMPPEAVKDPPVYTAKIDSFAIGTLIIQILTRCFPKPGDRHRSIKIQHPQFPSGKVEVRISEVERRQNHISLADPNHSLFPIALGCLSDADNERPSAQELNHKVAALKETPQYDESVKNARKGECNTTELKQHIRKLQKQVQENDDVIQEKNDIIRDKDDIIQMKEDVIKRKDQTVQQKQHTIEAGQHENRQIKEQLEKLSIEKDCVIKERERQLETCQEIAAKLHKHIKELEKKQPKRTLPMTVLTKMQQSQKKHTQSPCSGNSIKLRWREVKKSHTPRKLYKRPDAVVNGDTIYLRAAATQNVYAYNSTDESWFSLPDTITELCSLAVINNLLTTIGGWNVARQLSSRNVTNQLFSLTGEGISRKWRNVFPSMPTKRSSTAAVTFSGQALIVVGGVDQKYKELKTVEVMDIATQQWFTAADLPDPLYNTSITICNDHVYLLGGWNAFRSAPTTSVLICLLNDLLYSCQPKSLEETLAQSCEESSTVWKKIADIEVTLSTCVTLSGRLLAIGGCESKENPVTSDVRMYQPISNTWEVIGRMNISRRQCFAVVLSNNALMVVGGLTGNTADSETNSLEIASIV